MIVAQLSDIHANGADDRLERLDRVLRWLKPLKPEAIIVSGDLAEDRHKESYEAIRERLDRTGSPYYLVPGNVDEHGDMRDVFGDRFQWPSDKRALNCSGQIGKQLRVIGLDVTVAGADYGDALPVLDWLRDELNADGPPALIFQHQHPFACGITGKDINMCAGADALAEVINAAANPVVALTCGHVHRPMFTLFADRPATMCPSVKPANKLKLDGKEPTSPDPPGLMLHHFDEGRLVSHVVMVPGT